MKQSSSSVLNALFERLVETSLFCNQELIQEVYKLGGVPRRGTLTSAQHLSAWLEVHYAADQCNNRKLADACLAAECFSVLLSARTSLKYAEHLNTQQSAMLRRHMAMLRSDLRRVYNLCHIFAPVTLPEPTKAAERSAVIQTTIQVIEPLKNAGRRILAAFATGASNFGPSIR